MEENKIMNVEANQQISADISANNAGDITTARIMMVDDEIITMEIVQTFLEEAGYEKFELVDDPKQAMDVMEQSNPDILLLDLIMPDVSGFDILEKVRNHQRFQHLPIIILTGSSDHESKLHALDLGATDFLAKPVDPSELNLRVRNTLSAKAYQDQLAFYDPVTNLPNRKLFADRLEWAIKKAKRYDFQMAVINLSIDKFSQMNASIGVNGADELLRQVAGRMEKLVRNVDLIGRTMGEDEESGLYRLEGSSFSLLLDRINGLESAAIVAERIVTEMRASFCVSKIDLYVTVSAGVSTFPEESEDPRVLIELATSAREHAKNKGGDTFQFSSNTIKDLYEKRIEMESKLRRAMANDELVLYYQPKVNVSTGTIAGVEALIRWDSDMGFISPAEFIPLAEETGLIIPIGEWVFRESCEQLSEWNELGMTNINMNVNLSLKQFNDPDFLSTIERVIEEANVDPQFLTLEITESLLMENIDFTIDKLNRLKNMGLKLSIDDFGTGYSSFSYLSRLPVDELKIDRAFIMNLPEDESSAAIVTSIIFLASKLNLKIVAEGVETEEQLEFLKDTMCETYQGFFFSRPVPKDELLALLNSEN